MNLISTIALSSIFDHSIKNVLKIYVNMWLTDFEYNKHSDINHC